MRRWRSGGRRFAYPFRLWAPRSKAVGRLEDARSAYARAAAVAPASAVAEHNLASILGDLEGFADSEVAARRALAKGLDAPETWLVLARALLGQGRAAEAEDAYRAVIARRPDHVEAHGELAQLIWMRTDDVEAAAIALDLARIRFPNLQALALKKGPNCCRRRGILRAPTPRSRLWSQEVTPNR